MERIIHNEGWFPQNGELVHGSRWLIEGQVGPKSIVEAQEAWGPCSQFTKESVTGVGREKGRENGMGKGRKEKK